MWCNLVYFYYHLLSVSYSGYASTHGPLLLSVSYSGYASTHGPLLLLLLLLLVFLLLVLLLRVIRICGMYIVFKLDIQLCVRIKQMF